MKWKKNMLETTNQCCCHLLLFVFFCVCLFVIPLMSHLPMSPLALTKDTCIDFCNQYETPWVESNPTKLGSWNAAGTAMDGLPAERLTAIICVTIAYLKPFVLLTKPRQSLTAWWKVCQPKPKHAEWSCKRSSDLLAHVEPESEVISIKTKVKMLKNFKPQLKHPSPPAPAKPAGHPIAQLTEAIDPGPHEELHFLLFSETSWSPQNGTATSTEDLSNTTVWWSKTKDHHFSGGFLEILLAFRSAILRGNEIPRFNVNDSDWNDPKWPKFSGGIVISVQENSGI